MSRVPNPMQTLVSNLLICVQLRMAAEARTLERGRGIEDLKGEKIVECRCVNRKGQDGEVRGVGG